MPIRFGCKKFLMLASASLICAPSAVNAQSGEDGGTQAASVDQDEENVIVVTALRSGETDLMRTPIAISAIQGSSIESQAITEIGDAISNEPGVSVISYSAGNSTVQMRGLSALDGDSIVGYYLDEFPFASTVALPDANPFDLERIEVLRGPQGTLYGGSSLAGTVRLITVNPDLDDFQAKIMGSYSNLLDEGSDGYSLNTVLNMPLVPGGLAARAVYSRREIGGFLDAPGIGEKNINGAVIDSFRGKIKAQPFHNLSLVGTVWLNRLNGGGQDFGTADRIALAEQEDLEGNYDLYNFVAELNLGSVNLISSTSYLSADRRLDAIYPLVGGDAIVENFTEEENFTQEIRFSTDFNGNINFTGGAIYTDITTDLTRLLDFAGFVQNDEVATTSESWAVFAEATAELMDGKLQLTAGLRYFEDRRTNAELSDQVFLGFPLGLIDYGTRRAKFDALSPKFNVSYLPNDDFMVYANIAKGFRSGRIVDGSAVARGAASGVTVDPSVDPDVLWNYEIGTKASFAQGRLSVRAALYYMDWSNVQLTVPIAAGAVGVPANGGDAESLGFEIGLESKPVDGLTLGINANLNNAKFSVPVPALNIVEGDQLDNSVREQFSASAEYRWSVGSLFAAGDEALIATSLSHSSAREIRGFGLEDIADPITILDVRLGVENDSWGVYLIGTNLFDERGAAGGGGGGFLLRLPPRSLGASVRFSY